METGIRWLQSYTRMVGLHKRRTMRFGIWKTNLRIRGKETFGQRKTIARERSIDRGSHDNFTHAQTALSPRKDVGASLSLSWFLYPSFSKYCNFKTITHSQKLWEMVVDDKC